MYETGLGQFNIAISSSDAVRRFLAAQRYGTFGTPTTTTPTTTTPIRTPTTTFIPRTTTTTFKPVAAPLPVLKPAVSVTAKPLAPRPTPVVLNVGGSGTATPQIAEETSAMSGAFSFTKSPLPLILAGLAALFLLNKKGR